MPRSCYLGKRKSTEDEKISLHKFPKTPEVRKKWIDACGLHEKDVSHIYICSHHFELPDNLVALNRLPPGAIPTIAIPNHSIELSNVSTIKSTTVNTSKSSEVNISNSNIMDCANAVHSVSEASTYHSLPIIESTSMSNLSKVNITSPIVPNEMDFDDEVQPISEVSTDYSFSKENISPPRKRLFAKPRYISEINTSDVSTPKRTRRVISFIKQMDQKKSKQIKDLQDENRRLRKRIVTLQELVSHLKESTLISEDVGDHLMTNQFISNINLYS
ncbi:uncharacterized protein [Mycetomoellerius zeteki]|uniref:uncharacterized protein n=1 Tax=Mycetomoellerius zeteki TaxID=64791 RepID=UPI00084E779D|nr:PREDICTED: uncharacterized protein LOC108731766 [Trachymyrmex zeteki]